jgi:hypothetical protein
MQSAARSMASALKMGCFDRLCTADGLQGHLHRKTAAQLLLSILPTDGGCVLSAGSASASVLLKQKDTSVMGRSVTHSSVVTAAPALPLAVGLIFASMWQL